MIDEHLADLAPADQHGRQSPRARCRPRRRNAAAPARAGLRRQRGERRLLRRLPDHAVAADQRERRVPRPDRHREIEGGDDADDAERMPGLHHAVVGALGGDRQAVELPRQADREVADVDHLLHLAGPFGGDLADLDRDQPAERRLVRAQLLAEQPHELAALGRRHVAPGEEGLARARDRLRGFRRRRSALLGDRARRKSACGRQPAAAQQRRVDAERGEQVARFGRTVDREWCAVKLRSSSVSRGRRRSRAATASRRCP